MTVMMVAGPAAAGLLAGLLLLRRVPTLPSSTHKNSGGIPLISVVIPARNEAQNLPVILKSLQTSEQPAEVIVADDASSDATAEIARKAGATILAVPALPEGWRGKAWACQQGAEAAQQNILLFLDADTYFLPGGFKRLSDYASSLSDFRVLSILPFHRTAAWYEQLSLFFNLLMAIGAGGFGKMDSPRIFGQCMAVSRTLYRSAGGHAAVHGETLENLRFTAHVRRSGGSIQSFGGAGTIEMRMFPEGFDQLHTSWKKGFLNGATSCSPQVLALSYLYLSGCSYICICLLLTSGPSQTVAGAIYLAYAALLAIQSRQLGTYRRLTCLFFPIPLFFYFAVFGQAALVKLRGGTVSWRGRQV